MREGDRNEGDSERQKDDHVYMLGSPEAHLMDTHGFTILTD